MGLREFKGNSLQIMTAIVFTIMMVVTIWQTAVATREKTINDLTSQSSNTLSLFVSSLQGHLDKFETLPQLIAASQPLDIVLAPGGEKDPDAVFYINRYLERLNTITGAMDTYLLNTNGLTIAASNWNTPQSFVGKNFSFRPYFQIAMEGRLGNYFALGTTSKKRGYYFSYPVRRNANTVGVVVVKADVSGVEQSWQQSSERVIVTDPNGVIFISSKQEWLFKTLSKLDEDTKTVLKLTQRYPNEDLQPLTIFDDKKAGLNSRILTMREWVDSDKTTDTPAGRRIFDVLMQSREMPGAGWTVHILKDMSPVKNEVASAVALAFFAVTMLYLAAVFFIQRHQATLERRRLREERTQALRAAYDELEVRVQDRTKDLQDANIKLTHEIGERKKVENDLRQTQDELAQAAKLAALGQMAAGITHEINQPLTAMRSYADNARVFLKRNRAHDAHDNLEMISELTDRMAKIISHLKIFGRKGSTEITAVSMADVVEQAVHLLRTGGKLDRVSIHNAVIDDGHRVLGEPIRLEQVLLNLLQNAVDAMADRKVKQIDISTETTTETMTLVVKDTGPGIDEDHLAKVFDPFFTTKPVGKGMGLGLSISYGIIQDFGGTIRASNHKDGGTVFRIELKLADNPKTLIGSADNKKDVANG